MCKLKLNLFEGLIVGKRDCLSRAITLIESSLHEHKVQSQVLLQRIIESKHRRNYFNLANTHTLRIGITGPPGTGKSSFIEELGMRLVGKKHKVAVISVDPSSHISGGSILGDKTRMDLLSREPNAFIRGSPAKGVLGGIAEHTADVITLCEAAGYDTVIVESVGLGQSEVDIDRAVDMMLLLIPPTGGDSLQASKKGIMESADMLIVTKGDGELLQAANQTKMDYTNSMRFIQPKYPASKFMWQPPIMVSSVISKLNFNEIETEILKFHEKLCSPSHLSPHSATSSMSSSASAAASSEAAVSKCYIDIKRTEQKLFWMQNKLNRIVLNELYKNKDVNNIKDFICRQVQRDQLTPTLAAKALYDEFLNSIRRNKKPKES